MLMAIQLSTMIKKKVIHFTKDDVLNKYRKKTLSICLGQKVHHRKMCSKSKVKCEQHLGDQREGEGHLQKSEIIK